MQGCYICGEEASQACFDCGRAICKAHLVQVDMTGYCVNCGKKYSDIKRAQVDYQRRFMTRKDGTLDPARGIKIGLIIGIIMLVVCVVFGLISSAIIMNIAEENMQNIP
ncbi:MAG: hypothetical protein GF383_12280 [Candidatus Lokiarchaeota archaeon]|nr:hypothetical protein [Candidatus Lokiarchaeota archaeon]MBD3341769.1 hypothetical protein [Candidatus Lokiarchaeota archaeon]